MKEQLPIWPNRDENPTDDPFDYAMGKPKEMEDMEAAKQEPNDFDDNKKANASRRLDDVIAKGEERAAIHPVQIVTDLKTGETETTESGIAIGARGFLAVLKDGTVTATTRKELRQRIASLMANEAHADDSMPIEVYRVTRLPLALKLDFKF